MEIPQCYRHVYMAYVVSRIDGEVVPLPVDQAAQLVALGRQSPHLPTPHD